MRVPHLRRFARMIGMVLLCCGVSGVFGAQARRNILFILVDDQSPFDLRIYDRTSALQTPVIDRLAAEGMVLDAAYHMGAFVGAVCTPSRHMIMSGRTLWHLPIAPAAQQKGLSRPQNSN